MKTIFNLPLPHFIIDEENEALARNARLEKLFPSREVPSIPEAFRQPGKQLHELVKGDVIEDGDLIGVVVVTATNAKPDNKVIVRSSDDEFYDVEDNVHGDRYFNVIENVA